MIMILSGYQWEKRKVNFAICSNQANCFVLSFCYCIWWRNHLGNWVSFVGLLATSSFAIYYDSSRQPRQWRSICYCPQENREIFFVYFEFNKFESFQFSNKVSKLCLLPNFSLIHDSTWCLRKKNISKISEKNRYNNFGP